MPESLQCPECGSLDVAVSSRGLLTEDTLYECRDGDCGHTWRPKIAPLPEGD